MAIDFALLGHYVSDLYAAVSVNERFQVYGRYIRQLGFDGATYTFAPRIQYEIMPALPAIFLFTESYPVGFLEHYRRERLDEKDFTVRKVLGGDVAPMDWREYELNGLVSEAEASVIRLARDEYGIRNAISIPTMLEERGAAGASIISQKADEEFQQLKHEQLELLVSMTRLFHDTNFVDAKWSLQFIRPILASLTKTEIYVLRYKASGRPIKNIDEENVISKYYADNVFSNMKKRLGHVNTERLMYLLGLLDVFSDAPSDED